MFLVVHAAVGAIAGNVVAKPLPALALGFISHFFVDMIPHGDENVYNDYKNGNKVKFAYFYVVVDVVLTIAMTAMLFVKQDFFSPLNVSLGIIGGLLPDVLVGLVEFFKLKGGRWVSRNLAAFHRFHMRNHHFAIKHLRKFERDIPLRYGLLVQVIALATLVKIIL